MADFGKIWEFVARELKVPIPPYIRNVLKLCGFDNCYTISTIDEKDLEHFQTEVRNGDIKKFFEMNKVQGVNGDNVLEGSTRAMEDFEFSRGHLKLIMAIIKLVKENLSENGIDGSSDKFKANQKRSSNGKNLSGVPHKRQKYSSDELKMESTLLKSDQSNLSENSHLISFGKNKTIPIKDVTKYHEKTLVKKAIASLIKITPKLYEENLAIIKAAVTTNLIYVKRKKEDEPLHLAKITCPFCNHPIRAFHILNGSNVIGSWNHGNFGRHLEEVHLKKNSNKWTRNKHDEDLDAFYDGKNENDGNTDNENSDDKNCNKENSNKNQNENIDGGKLNIDINVGSIVDMKDVETITSNKIILTSVVDYSDTDESENDGENCYFFMEVPGKLAEAENMDCQHSNNGCDVDKDCKSILSDTFIISSNQKSEILADISLNNFPDSIESYLSNDDTEEKNVENVNGYNPEKDPDNLLDTVESIPVFCNGYRNLHSKPTITTFNTCAFDSVFSIYASLYFDNPIYQKFTDLFVARSDFSELLKKFFETFNSKSKLKSISEDSKELYDCRNHILKEIFGTNYYRKGDHILKNSKSIFINCETGIGGFFGQICFGMNENIASAIETKICYKCETTKGKIQPFLSVAANDVDVRNIGRSISFDRSKDLLCKDCKSECKIEKMYNNILVLEVEPNTKIEFQTTVSIQELAETITVGKKYKLYAVIQYKPSIKHYVSHVNRKGNVWKTYDDLKSTETDSDITQEILPYMLFYINNTGINTFEKTLLSFFQNNKLCIPMSRKILSSERRNTEYRAEYNKPSASSTGSSSASEDWKKKREREWKY